MAFGRWRFAKVWAVSSFLVLMYVWWSRISNFVCGTISQRSYVFDLTDLNAFTDFCPDRFFWSTRFLFLIFPYFFRFCAVRQTKLAISSAFERPYYIVPYRIVLDRQWARSVSPDRIRPEHSATVSSFGRDWSAPMFWTTQSTKTTIARCRKSDNCTNNACFDFIKTDVITVHDSLKPNETWR